MVSDELAYRIREHLRHQPTPEQAQAIGVFCRFATDRSPMACMVLRGAAGTGKTTLAGSAFISPG